MNQRRPTRGKQPQCTRPSARYRTLTVSHPGTGDFRCSPALRRLGQDVSGAPTSIPPPAPRKTQSDGYPYIAAVEVVTAMRCSRPHPQSGQLVCNAIISEKSFRYRRRKRAGYTGSASVVVAAITCSDTSPALRLRQSWSRREAMATGLYLSRHLDGLVFGWFFDSVDDIDFDGVSGGFYL
jgi:hypothetical protein